MSIDVGIINQGIVNYVTMLGEAAAIPQLLYVMTFPANVRNEVCKKLCLKASLVFQ